MSYVIGFDVSTQSFSAVLIDATDFRLIDELSVNFGKELPQYNSPEGFLAPEDDGTVHSSPLMWLEGLEILLEKMVSADWPLSKVSAISGSGQQHGSVYLNAHFSSTLAKLSPKETLTDQLRPCLTRPTSPIWMDSSTRQQCDEIAETLGGDPQVCSLSGSVMTERFTGAQIRKFAQTSPEAYAETAHIHLVSSFFCSLFAGVSSPIDTGDGAGMNLMNLAANDWDDTLLDATAETLGEKLPPVAPPHTIVGKISPYFTEKCNFNPDCQVILWSGDNPCSIVGMGASREGKIVISLGTSYTLFSSMTLPVTDPNGFGHVFGNPMGGYMSLLCFKNGSLAREEVRKRHELDWKHFGTDLLAETPAGNDGKLMLPFYEPELTPLTNVSAPITSGWDLAAESPAVEVRACLEGQFLNMREHSDWLRENPSQLLLTGGGSKSEKICQLVADIFDLKVVRMTHSGSAALGAAIIAGVGAEIAPLADWEAHLCTVDIENAICPIPENVQTYDALRPTFRELYAHL